MKTPGIIDWSTLDAAGLRATLARPPLDRAGLESDVAAIIERVGAGGDAAVRDYTRQFDGVDVPTLEVAQADIDRAPQAIEKSLWEALQRAADRIERFHRASLPTPVRLDTARGLRCEARYLPISPVGLYVPGGSAPLISTVLMLAIPARLAGCTEIILCTPPAPDGSLPPALLAAASLCGVRRVFRAGGAQAIAAMALGTETVPACAKLFGPGNAWVTEAKRQVATAPGGAAQDLPAGPSEVLVIADQDADPVAVSWDLLSQAEHGPDSQAVLVSDSRALLESVAATLPGLVETQPRAKILGAAMDNLRLIQCPTLGDAVRISNAYAPEHLILNCAAADSLLERVCAAGSVFVGRLTPESLGDYASGTNHVLPTYGYARAYSGLGVADFLRRMTVQRANEEGLREAGRDAMRMARAEGLEAHRMAIAWRLRQLDGAA